MVESGEPREVMHFCLLSGYGANAVNPYLAFEAIGQLRADGMLSREMEADHFCDRYVTAIKKGILKTMSKMGHIDAAELSFGPAVRGRGAGPTGGGQVFLRHGIAD